MEGAEVGAQGDARKRHIADVEKDCPLERRAVQIEGEIEDGRALQHAPERLAEATDGRRDVLDGARHLAAQVLFEVVLIGGAFRLYGAVLIDRRKDGGTVDGDAHRRLVCLFDGAREHLPVLVEGIGDFDGRELGQRGEPARKDHLVGVVRGRLIRRGVEIIGLRIAAVGILDDFVGGEQRLLVDDVDGELRRGKAVLRDEVLKVHMRIRLPRLPFGAHHLVIGGSIVGRTQPPEDLVARIAELARRLDHRTLGDVRDDEHPFRILLVGAHRLLHERGIRRAVHLGIPACLPLKDGVHIGDVLERRVHVGRGAVRGSRLRDCYKPLFDDVGSRLLEKLGHEDARPHTERDDGRADGDRPVPEFLIRTFVGMTCSLYFGRALFRFHNSP